MARSSDPSPHPRRRAAALVAERNRKMARSQHAYVRGSTAKFYEWLEAGRGTVPAGPSVWICGDCHVGNLGPLADAKGRVDVQIRDLDQTVIGNPAHDLVRLGLSLASAARGSNLPGAVTARILEEIAEGYRTALEAPDAEGPHSEKIAPRPKVVDALLKRAMKRKWRHLAKERLEDLKPSIPLGRHFWALEAKERRALEGLVEAGAVRTLLQRLNGLGDDVPVEVVDAAYWMKGCSSLGRLRYAVLAAVGGGDGGEDKRFLLIDIKEGVRAAAPKDPQAEMPRDNAERVVAGALALSPNLGERMAATRLLGRAVVVRELMPQDLKIEIDALSPDAALSIARYLAAVVARSHGRQMEAGDRRAWAAELKQSSGRTLDAPAWLWSSVVDLVAQHEGAYLEHCRRYALEAA